MSKRKTAASTEEQFAITPEEFHRIQAERQASRPVAMTTLSTHDTKRAEDVRARISVISEIPNEWSAAVRRWRAFPFSEWLERRLHSPGVWGYRSGERASPYWQPLASLGRLHHRP